MDYNSTVNLPQTEFPMRGGLPQREPVWLASWQQNNVYQQLMKHNEGKPSYIMHDGPPFSNGEIHAGHALNKILKDIVVRYKNMVGFQAPNTPGWDNHGMPIESAIIKKQKLDAQKLSPVEFRDACRAFAQHYVDVQREGFIRLGALGDWDNPYLTMDAAFEAAEVKVFGAMAAKGCLYKALKPVYWCAHDQTALAEAEIEYKEDECQSIYVKFEVKQDNGLLNGRKTYVVIWTTTTWTLPGNVAVSVHPRSDYVQVQVGDVCYIVAEALLVAVAKAAGWSDWMVLATFKGQQMERMTLAHPFLDRDSLVICGEHVTMDSGTGCVHTAPGHGADDFIVCRNYDLPTIVPVNGKGVLTEEAGPFAGQYYAKANKTILEALQASGHLLASETIVHTYPHCWRCGDPIVFRATEQWFVSIDAIREAACDAIKGVQWVPGWSQERMLAMVGERSDWCISRQRNWGLPIPAFLCCDCDGYLINDASIEKISGIFASEGSNAWLTHDVADLLPDGAVCPKCGGRHFRKETDTLDGWFDSGSTHAHVLNTFPHMRRPADLYLEGNDQFRGWFQSSLLTSIVAYGDAPYKTVVTCGMIVDGDGKKMSKSLGNGIDPMDVAKEFGVDVLRLWVASGDYHSDLRISKDLLKQTAENYKKIRNTARFILGVLSDYTPDKAVAVERLLPIDRYALSQLNKLVARVRDAYDSFDFHGVAYALHNFCVVEMSNFYLDVLKDTLYCDVADGLARRSAQTVLHLILDALTKMMAPILCFTAEEIWQCLPHAQRDNADMVLFNDIPAPQDGWALDEATERQFERLMALRDEVNKALETARGAGQIGKSLEAEVAISCQPDDFALLTACEGLLKQLFIVSGVAVTQGAFGIAVTPATGGKCIRCWMQSGEVGSQTDHPELCGRCADAVRAR